jgi:hypothetical protein
MVWSDVRVRPFQAGDIHPWIEYLYRSPRSSSFLQQLNLSQFPNENDYRNQLHDVVSNFAKSPWVTVEAKGHVVGVHFLTESSGTSADFQAHIWNPEFSGKGVGVISWFKACAYFFESLADLETIFFKFPSGDAGIRRFVSKLPLTKVGEEPLRSMFFREGQIGTVYKITRNDFEAMQQQQDDAGDDDDF